MTKVYLQFWNHHLIIPIFYTQYASFQEEEKTTSYKDNLLHFRQKIELEKKTFSKVFLDLLPKSKIHDDFQNHCTLRMIF